MFGDGFNVIDMGIANMDVITAEGAFPVLLRVLSPLPVSPLATITPEVKLAAWVLSSFDLIDQHSRVGQPLVN
jgi:hypothetical protein